MQKRRVGRVAFLAVSMVALGLVPTGRVAHAATSDAVTVGDLTVVEGDVGSTVVRIPITLQTPAIAPVTVTWGIIAGTATRRKDFTGPTSGREIFNIGEVSKSVAVTVVGDAAVEGSEYLALWVTAVSGAAVGDGAGVLTLTDNDANGVSAVPEVTAGKPILWEGNSGEREAQVPIRLSRPSFNTVTVTFNDGCTARNVKFLPGQLDKAVPVAVPGNLSASPNYAIPSSLRVAGGYATLPAAAGAVTVRDDDGGGSPQAVGSTIRASETTLGRQAKYPDWGCEPIAGYSRAPSMSANGRYVAFESNAWNLVPYDMNGKTDVFVKDLWTGIIELVSKSSSGVYANGVSGGPTISPDGRFVLFTSDASNLVSGKLQWWHDVFIHDRLSHSTNLIAPYSDVSFSSLNASISADNRYVAFESKVDLGGDTDAGETCETPGPCPTGDVFILDRTTGTYTPVTTGENGTPQAGWGAVISASGTTVAYMGLPDGDRTQPATSFAKSYVTDWQTGVTEVITVNSAEAPLAGWGPPPQRMAISANGRQVAFVAEACNLGAPCLIGPWPDYRTNMQVYVRDRNTGTTSVESINGPSPYAVISTPWTVALSANGRYVTFVTNDPAVIPGWTTRCYKEVVQRDRLTGARVRVSSSRFGGCPTGGTDEYPHQVASSSDGNFVAFESEAKDLVNRDGGVDADVFVTRLR